MGAIGSCIPFIGGFFYNGNIAALREEMRIYNCGKNAYALRNHLNQPGDEAQVAGALPDDVPIEEALNKFGTTDPSQFIKKRNIYLSCGLVGSVLTIALAVKILALKAPNVPVEMSSTVNGLFAYYKTTIGVTFICVHAYQITQIYHDYHSKSYRV